MGLSAACAVIFGIALAHKSANNERRYPIRLSNRKMFMKELLNENTRPSPQETGLPRRKATVTPLGGRSEADAALMLRVRSAADRAAFEELANHYGPRLKAWLMKRGEGSATAEDIVQDVISNWMRRLNT